MSQYPNEVEVEMRKSLNKIEHHEINGGCSIAMFDSRKVNHRTFK